MIQISKAEAQLLRKKFPYLHIAKTRHKYYATEDIAAMRALTGNISACAIVKERSKTSRGEMF